MPFSTVPDKSVDDVFTEAMWDILKENLNFLQQVAYVEFISDVTVNGTTVGAANQIVSAGAIVYENVPHLIEFWASRYTPAAAASNFIVRDGSTVLGTLLRYGSGEATSPMYGAYRLTPTAASHTYNIAGWTESAATHTVRAGTGGVAGDATTHLPGFIRITRVPTG